MKKSRPLIFGEPYNNAATDVEKLISRGFDEKSSRDALALSKGNYDLALKHLRSSLVANEASESNEDSKLSWVGEVAGEWKDKDLGSGPEMTSKEARALWKSPYYIRIGKYVRLNKNEIGYALTVIARDGVCWEVIKSLTDFYSFWAGLPFGMGLHSKLHLKTGFPLWKLNSLSLKSMILGGFRTNMTEEEIEERRDLLENWLRELCLDEECMTNVPFLTALQNFIEAENFQSSTSAPLIETCSMSSDMQPISKKSPLRSQSSGSTLHNWTKLPHNTINAQFPVPFNVMVSNLPTKVNLADVLGKSNEDSIVAENLTNKDTSLKQLAKDMSRDRVVIQGIRYQGVDSTLDDLILACISSARAVLNENNMKSFPDEVLTHLALRTLRQISRTESAYVSHTALSMAISLEDCPDVAIVPESLLAEPLRIHFRAEKTSKYNETSVRKTAQPTANDNTVPLKDNTNSKNVNVCSSPHSHISLSCNNDKSSLPTATPVNDESSEIGPLVEALTAVTSSNPFDDKCLVNVASDRVSSPVVECKKKSPIFRESNRRPEASSSLTHTSPFFKSGNGKYDSSIGAKPSLDGPQRRPMPTPSRRPVPPPTAPPHPASALPHNHHTVSSSQNMTGNLICDMQATTVFRFTNIMNMQCVLQLKVTFCKSLKLCHSGDNYAETRKLDQASSVADSSCSDHSCNSSKKDAASSTDIETSYVQSSKCFIVLERETKTSNRDWRHDQHI